MAHGQVEHLLHAMDVRGERGDDDAAARSREKIGQRAADAALRRAMPGDERVRRVAQQREHPLLAVAREGGQVGGATIDRRVIDLEVAGVDDRSDGRADGQAEGVDDGVRHLNRFHAKRADFDHVARHERAQFHFVDGQLLELVAHEAEGQRHAVDWNVEPFDQERHRADVVFVAVREEDRAQLRRLLEEVRHVRDDDVHSERGRVGKHHPAVDGDGRALVLVHHEVHADLAEATEGNEAQRVHTRRAGYRNRANHEHLNRFFAAASNRHD